MANPQTEDGYTKIANELLDELVKVCLLGAELQVCLFIIRKTYGYGKKEDAISLTQFEQGINKSRPTIVKALKNLQLVNMVELVKSGDSKNSFNIYRLNKNYESWQLVRTCQLVKRNNLTSKGEAKKLVKTCKHTKENTKENTKERATLPAGLSEETFSEYLDMRKKIKKPLLEKSFNRFFKSLSTICQQNKASPEDILNQSILNSWQGIFPLKQEFKANANTGFTTNKKYFTERDAINAAAADEADIINRERAERLKRKAENTAAGSS